MSAKTEPDVRGGVIKLKAAPHAREDHPARDEVHEERGEDHHGLGHGALLPVSGRGTAGDRRIVRRSAVTLETLIINHRSNYRRRYRQNMCNELAHWLR